MTDFEYERLNRYVEDAEQWLGVIRRILLYPETTSQAAAAAMAGAAMELVYGIRQQIMIDKN